MNNITKICNALEELGPMTAFDLAEILGMKYERVLSAITKHRSKGFDCEERKISVCSGIRTGKRPRAVYGVKNKRGEIVVSEASRAAREKMSRGQHIKAIDVSVAKLLASIREYPQNPFAVSISQCGVGR